MNGEDERTGDGLLPRLVPAQAEGGFEPHAPPPEGDGERRARRLVWREEG